MYFSHDETYKVFQTLQVEGRPCHLQGLEDLVGVIVTLTLFLHLIPPHYHGFKIGENGMSCGGQVDVSK